ncbi:hypothetical protein DMB92_04600 [Campylobacter sp. MIT 99-7217]|uniref:tetratricopeptide repeat protein n=1 Tax=Campylobacter sp. MIT 99-7217 TaxID=535091 RepID=UPI0011581019|nr:hypothetical protein [Campylobacter sp. MIT 99-7217]TQR32383.1 hypothetical protein DMB92_04600 [Campylobacter sp. MIT 99-7217]
MDFFFVEYRDPVVGLIVLIALILFVALGHYFYKMFAIKDEAKNINNFIKQFEINNAHKDLLRASSLSLNNLIFLATVFTKSGEFEKATQIYLIALEKTKDKDEQELLFYDLAQVYFKAGFLQRSVEVLLNALKIRPRNEKSLKLLRIVYLRLKQYKEVLEVLECLFELGFDVEDEKNFAKALMIKEGKKSEQEKLDESLKLDLKYEILKRFIFENYKFDIFVRFDLIVDLLYRRKEAIFINDQNYYELFCALHLTKENKALVFKNSKLKMLKILKDNNFKARLSFSYMCKECKNQMPIFFYHCPICYEFNKCQIFYELRDDEKN